MNAPQLPAFLQNKPSRGIAATLSGNLGAGSPPFLSIMGNRFTLIDAAGEEIPVATYDPKIGPYVDCIVMDALEHTSKIYYDKAYDPAASQYEPPACFSDNGVAPSRNASRPQARTCAECPQGAWGSNVSAVSGKGVKACSDIQKIALLVPGYDMPFLLRIPPNSRNGFRGFVNKFVGQQVDVSDVVTRISFEQGSIGTLRFEAASYIDEATYAHREKLMAAKATDSMIGRTDLPRQDALPAPATPAGLPAPEQQVQQPAPFVPPAPAAFAPPAAAQPMQMAPQMAAPAPAAQPASPSEPPRTRKRRTAAATAPAAQAPGFAPPAQQTAPFMPQPAPAAAPPAAPFAVAAPAPAQPANFGIQQAPAPAGDLANTLNSLFGAPTNG